MTQTTQRKLNRARARRQHGVALFFSMILLLIMTVLAVASMRGTMLQERMSSNMRQKQHAFEAAELALRRGEDILQTAQKTGERPIAKAPSNCSGPPCTVYAYVDGGLDLMDPDMWSGQFPQATTGQDQLAGNPQFVVEFRKLEPDTLNVGTQSDQRARYFYRVAARGVGEEAAAESIVQSTFVTRF